MPQLWARRDVETEIRGGLVAEDSEGDGIGHHRMLHAGMSKQKFVAAWWLENQKVMLVVGCQTTSSVDVALVLLVLYHLLEDLVSKQEVVAAWCLEN